MNVYDLLNDTDGRISLGNKWMVFDEDDGWIIYERKPYAKKTEVILETVCEEDAVAEMMKEWG